MLEMVRWLVCWNPIILTALHFVFHATGIDAPVHPHPPPPPGAPPLPPG